MCKQCYGKWYYKQETVRDRTSILSVRRYAALPDERKRAQRDKAWANQIKRLYRISALEYELMEQQQGGVCAICGGKTPGRRLSVDHCHDSGRVRGLLCQRCNGALHFMEDEV